MSAILIRALGPTKICLIRSFASSETRGLLGNSSFPRLTGVGLNGKVLNNITYSIMPLLQTSTDLASYDLNPSISGAANRYRSLRPCGGAVLFITWCMVAKVGVVAKGAQRPAYSIVLQAKGLHTHVHGCANHRLCHVFVSIADNETCQLYDSALLAANQQNIVQLCIYVGNPHAMAIVQCKEKLLIYHSSLLFLRYAVAGLGILYDGVHACCVH